MIDYSAMARSVKHYSRLGWERVEVPWLVTRDVSDVTKPDGANTYTVTRDDRRGSKVFVASGEQSLLYLIAKGNLPASGKFQTITPCMRDEPFDAAHWKQFIKNELITYWATDDARDDLVAGVFEDTLEAALAFFKGEARLRGADPDGVVAVREPGALTADVEYRGVELGSYGVRDWRDVTWVYGTGVAEPRMSTFLRK